MFELCETKSIGNAADADDDNGVGGKNDKDDDDDVGLG